MPAHLSSCGLHYDETDWESIVTMRKSSNRTLFECNTIRFNGKGVTPAMLNSLFALDRLRTAWVVETSQPKKRDLLAIIHVLIEIRPAKCRPNMVEVLFGDSREEIFVGTLKPAGRCCALACGVDWRSATMQASALSRTPTR